MGIPAMKGLGVMNGVWVMATLTINGNNSNNDGNGGNGGNAVMY